MSKRLWWYLFIGGIVAGTAGVFVTNPQLQQGVVNSFTPQYMLTTDPQQVPKAVTCNVPIDQLYASTKTVINSNPEGVCLGGLTIGGGPPVFGDANKRVVINTYPKYNNDLLARVVDDVLICQVPCSNANAYEIEWCNDLSTIPTPSFTIRAERTC